MKIREFAKSVNHEVVGKLTRRSEWEDGQCRCYIDEAGNEYTVSKTGCCIVTAEGVVI